MPNFEEFDRKQAGNPQVPSVTLTSRGAISFSFSAWELIGSPEAVKLLYDPDERIAAFKPAKKGERNAYVIRENRSVRTVMATAFCAHIGVKDSGESRRWPLYVEDGIGCIDLKQPGDLVTSGRAGTGGKRRRARQD